MSKVLVVGGGSGLQPKLRRSAPDVTTSVLCRASVLSWVHELGENVAVVVLNDDSPTTAWVSAARRIHQEWPFDTIASLAEIDQDKAAAIAEDLAIPFYAPETVRRAHDKFAMRTALAEAGLQTIPFRQVASEEELDEFFAEFGGPVMLKPTKGRASAGISVIHGTEDIRGAFLRTYDASAPRLERSLPLAERFVPGPEFSVEAVTHRGTHYVFGVTEKFKDDKTKVELGHVVPARISEAESDTIVAYLRRCLSALGIEQGITHTEVILSPDGPVLVETHLRQAGDEIIELVEAATGVDITDLLVLQIAGVDIASRPEVAARVERPVYEAAGSIQYLAVDVAGRLDGIDGLTEAAAEDGVDSAVQLVDDGTQIEGLSSSYSRLASIRVHGADADQALGLARDQLALLRVRLTIPG